MEDSSTTTFNERSWCGNVCQNMALYDNKHWLLSHIRNSFITSDDTGMCEVVMVSENIARQLPVGKYDCYPGVEQDDEQDDMDMMAKSYEIHSDLQFGLHRHRSNTAQHLERMEEEKKKAANTVHIKWITNPVPLTDEEKLELFPKKDINKIREQELNTKRVSLLTEMLAKCPMMPLNPFQEYAKFDGNAQVGVSTKKYGIFLTMLTGDARNYPMKVVIIATAKVIDLIGFVCWKCTLEHTSIVIKESVQHYSLYIAEDDGEVDWDFPCLDTRETVSKFGFSYLALVERDPAVNPDDSFSVSVMQPTVPSNRESRLEAANKAQAESEADLELMRDHMTALEASLYHAYNVFMLNRVRAKKEVYLGISGDKLEIDPVIQQKVSSKIWGKQRSVSHSMDYIVASELTESRGGNRAGFRVVYERKRGTGKTDDSSSSGTSHPSYKHYDFEADARIAADIVRKVNHILHVRQSQRRKDYIALRERNAHRRKSFLLNPR